MVKMIIRGFDNLGNHRVVFRSDNEPSILAVLKALKQETTAEGEPQSNCATESSVNVVKRHVISIKDLCRTPTISTDGFLFVETARQHTKEVWRGAPFGSVVDASAAIQPSSGPLNFTI